MVFFKVFRNLFEDRPHNGSCGGNQILFVHSIVVPSQDFGILKNQVKNEAIQVDGQHVCPRYSGRSQSLKFFVHSPQHED